MEWYTEEMRLKKQAVIRSDTNYLETSYKYDDWGNPTYIKEESRTGDRNWETETWMHYHHTSSEPAAIFNAYPTPYTQEAIDWRTRDRLLAKAVKNNPAPESGQTDPVYSVSYYTQ